MQSSVFIVAGEASGDTYGANLINELKVKAPSLAIYGFGGSKMEEAGAELIEDMHKISVVGLTEVIKHLPDVFKILKKIEAFLKREKPAFIILIDFPDFNFRVAKIADKYKIPVYYFVSPQIWAWRQSRVYFLKKYIRKIFVIFPFEESFYKKFNVNAQFIGHPLAKKIKKFNPSINFPTNKKYITLLPGSRYSEINRLLPVILDSVKLIKNEFLEFEFLLPVAPTLDFSKIKRMVEKDAPFVQVIDGNSYNAILAATIVISASGTATLESALFGKPVIIIYRVNFISYILGRIFIKVKHIGMPNLLLGDSYNPELIQHRVTAENIFIEVKKFLYNSLKYKKVSSMNRKLLEKLYFENSYSVTIDSILKEQCIL